MTALYQYSILITCPFCAGHGSVYFAVPDGVFHKNTTIKSSALAMEPPTPVPTVPPVPPVPPVDKPKKRGRPRKRA